MTTALVYLENTNGNFVKVRALLDTGSTVNLINKNTLRDLRVLAKRCSISVSGLEGFTTTFRESCKITFKSAHNEFKREISFLIVEKIADKIPNVAFPRDLFDLPPNLKLADPQFHLPSEINLLLSSGVSLSLLAVGQIRLTA